jgi:hypothetical protein
MVSHSRFVCTNKGFTLVEGLVVIGLVSIAGAALMNANVTAMKAAKSSSLRSELQDIKQSISVRLSCPKTMEAFGPTLPVRCSGPVILRDRNKTPLIPPNGKLGSWTITARCEDLGGGNGLSIYATKKNPNGSYAKDPLNSSIVLDESSPISLLYKADVRPCGDYFIPGEMGVASTPACPEGKTQSGKAADGSPNCISMPGFFSVPVSSLNTALLKAGDPGLDGLCDGTNPSDTYLSCMAGCSLWCQNSEGSKFSSGVIVELNPSTSAASCACF